MNSINRSERAAIAVIGVAQTSIKLTTNLFLLLSSCLVRTNHHGRLFLPESKKPWWNVLPKSHAPKLHTANKVYSPSSSYLLRYYAIKNQLSTFKSRIRASCVAPESQKYWLACANLYEVTERATK